MIETSWPQWQQQVLDKIRRDYAEILQHLTLDDIDWAAWRTLYDQGRSAADAVDHAFVREPPAVRNPVLIDNRAPAVKIGARSGR